MDGSLMSIGEKASTTTGRTLKASLPDEHARLGFEEIYKKREAPDWEKLPLDDLYEFLAEQRANPQQIQTILEIGCGSGLRLLHALLRYEGFNRSDLRVVAVDFAPSAIARAEKMLAQFRAGKPANGVHPSFPSGVLAPKFECKDWNELAADPALPRFDLVLDWMCFHEQRRDVRDRYERFINGVCAKLFAIKLFSIEGRESVKSLGAVCPNVPMHAFSGEEMTKRFGAFHNVGMAAYAEDPDPRPRHTLGHKAVHAKRAYLFVRKSESSPE
jgi:SAM-dependent methyltransferase